MFLEPHLWVRKWLAMPSYREARFFGTLDGTHGIPGGTEPSPWCQQCLRQGQLLANWLGQKFVRARQTWDGRCSSIRPALAQAEAEAARLGKEAQALLEEHTATRGRAAQLRQADNPMAGHTLPTWGYVTALLVLTTLELPLVYLSFMAFGLDPVQTALLSALAAALTAFLGHALGALARQLSIGARPFFIATLTLCIAFAGATAMLRETSLSTLYEEMLKLQAAVPTLASPDPSAARFSPTAAATALLVIGCVSLLAATLLSWFHRVEPLGAEEAETHRRWRLRAGEHKKALRHQLRLQQRLAGYQSRAGALAPFYRRLVHQLDNDVAARIFAYAGANLRARSQKAPVPALAPEHLPRIQMPDVMTELEDGEARALSVPSWEGAR